MDRTTLSVLVLAALAAAAIGLSAATLTSTVGPSDETGGDSSAQPEAGETSDSRSGPDAATVVGRLLVLVGVLVVLGYVALYREESGVLAAVVVFFVLAVILAVLVLGDTPVLTEEPPDPDGGEPSEGGGERTDSEENSGPDLPVRWLAGLFVAGVVGALLVVGYIIRGSAGNDESGPGAETASLGAVAGRAADRIESASAAEAGPDPDNEVYRAWREMTVHLDIERTETTTPREFQQQATEAGMAEDDVQELTALFEAVRYGDTAATEERERRAVSVLRRIESTYGGKG